MPVRQRDAALMACRNSRENASVACTGRAAGGGNKGDAVPETVKTLRSGKERLYAPLTIIFGILIWLLLAFIVVTSLADRQRAILVITYVAYAVIISVFLMISAAVYRAFAFGNMMLLSREQFPELHTMVSSASRDIGLPNAPATFLFNSNGLFNAFARRIFGRRFVFLTSALVEASSDEQVRFVIGHEVGHHAAGHLNFWLNLIKLPAFFVPFLGPAYSRARETTCDNIGAYLSGDFDASRSALQMLGCGCRRLNQSMNCEAFIAQESLVPPIFGFLTEIFRSHPRLTRRVANIKEYASRDRRS
jgi:Zn-dependent protease with chaperone function